MDNFKICIDAGHGGHVPGAVHGGVEEEDFNLIIASMVALQLMKLGHSVSTTRVDDSHLTLQKRCKIANDNECDLFVSIHANASFFKTARGVEVFYYSPRNSKIAKIVHDKIAETFSKLPDRGIKHGEFFVLRNTHMPAILIECAFMSNKEDLEFLKSEGNQVQLAESITEGIKEVFNGGCSNRNL